MADLVATASDSGAVVPSGAASQFARLPVRQKLVIMVGLAAAAAIVIGAWTWAQTPEYRVLFANLSDRDGGATLAALNQMNVPYKMAEGGGAIMVPAKDVHEMRLRLASQGLPKGGIIGYELVDNQKFGATQFQEQINYQRGLEGELARSIQSLAAVAAARVHLAIPKPSVFMREQQTPTASVLLTLHAGRTLDRAQISGIVHLVASSVPELSIDNVSVVDQSGALVSERKGGADGLDPSALSYIRQIEQATNQRIVDIVEPIVGRNNVRVQVTADIDFTRVEAVAETFKPNQDTKTAALRTQQSSQSSTAGAAGAQGVPGALSNQPPAGGTANVDGKSGGASASSAGGAPSTSRRDETASYEVDKTIQHTRNPVGNVKRLTAAVVINHRRLTAEDGKVTTQALTPAELEQITSLSREAMGFNKERGDSLNVVNAAFNEPERLPVAEVPMWKEPDNIAIAKDVGRYTVFALLIAYLVFGLLRPTLRQAAVRAAEVAASLPAPASPALAGPAGEDSMMRARRLAQEDPKIVANVVKAWVNKGE